MSVVILTSMRPSLVCWDSMLSMIKFNDLRITSLWSGVKPTKTLLCEKIMAILLIVVAVIGVMKCKLFNLSVHALAAVILEEI